MWHRQPRLPQDLLLLSVTVCYCLLPCVVTGNLVYRKTSRNHNPAIATAGKITIAEVEEIVPAGSLDPDEVPTAHRPPAPRTVHPPCRAPALGGALLSPCTVRVAAQVHTPGIYVNRVVQGDRMGVIERLTLADKKFAFNPAENPGDAKRERIVRRAALELHDGDYVNLGIGMPTLVSNYVPDDVHITLQSVWNGQSSYRATPSCKPTQATIRPPAPAWITRRPLSCAHRRMGCSVSAPSPPRATRTATWSTRGSRRWCTPTPCTSH